MNLPRRREYNPGSDRDPEELTWEEEGCCDHNRCWMGAAGGTGIGLQVAGSMEEHCPQPLSRRMAFHDPPDRDSRGAQKTVTAPARRLQGGGG
ncbi:hypothetical protein NDU88_004764 [Pleurodeles waltl]|uniref:Uncharacterized protein n=1 Tax=Pleurodeles waltl TaxID=8319 RepID=A0AAV7NPF1_PLEWA|nr:hypothetical protein NDU88_004764 [Pleurodeles waltl]